MEKEYLPILSDTYDVIGKAERSAFHMNPHEKLLHPVVHMHLINSIGEIYLQLRPMNKLIQPGKWDTAVGGHISYGESTEIALQRECSEEIGINSEGASGVLQYIWETEAEKELVNTYFLKSDIIPIPDGKEVEAGRFWSIAEIDDNLGKGVFTPNFEYEFKLLRENGHKFPH